MARVEIASLSGGVLQDRLGNALQATASIKNLDDSPATHYSAVTGGTSSTASLVSDADGTLALAGATRFIEEGSYKIDVPAIGVTGQLVEAVSGATLVAVETSVVAATRRQVLIAGADPTGAVASTTAIRAAITAAGANGVVAWPQGTYLTDELDVAVDGQIWLMEGVTLKANSNSINLIHWSGSNGAIYGWPTLDANGKTGCSALRVTPQDEAQTTTVVNQNWNKFKIGQILSFAEGVVLMCGPDVAGADSGCWYNHFWLPSIKFCTRGVWLRDAVAASGATPNRNRFMALRVGQAGCNTGLQIDGGDTNCFVSAAFEGISSGTSPNATPTAVKVASAGAVTGAACNSNAFYGLALEGNTRDLDNANVYTEIYGHNIGLNKRTGTQIPAVMIGADPSTQPLILPGFRYAEGSLAGAPANPQFTKLAGSLEEFVARQGVAGETLIGAIGPSAQSGIKFDADTVIYETLANDLTTGAGLRVGRFLLVTEQITTDKWLQFSTAITAASAPNNSIFRDSADNILKKKNNVGVVTEI